MTVVSYPIPAWQNLPIESDNYQPSNFFILAITRGLTTTVQTTTDNNFVVGQQVKFVIPSENKIYQLNNVSGYVIEIISNTTFVVDIDSRYMDAFVTTTISNQPQIKAIGDINSGQINSNGRNETLSYIPGSFINISPQ